MTATVYLSPTQIDTFKDCKRKWAWYKIAKIRFPPNQWAELGTRVHDVLERFLREAEPPDLNTEEGRIAAAGIEHLPPPRTGTTEGDFEFSIDHLLPGVVLRGRIDWRDDDTILDHKTTGDFKWAKDEETLRQDVQSVIYSVYGFFKGGKDRLENRWVYYKTRGKPKSKKVSLTVLRDETERQFLELVPVMAEMAELERAGVDPNAVEYNVLACDKYGGCPYRGEYCHLTGGEWLRGLMAQHTLAEELEKAKKENRTMSTLAERLRNRSNGAPAGQPPAVQPAQTQQQYAPPAQPAPAAQPAQTQQQYAPPAQPAPGINPPEAPRLAPTLPATTPTAANEPTLRDKLAGSALQGLVAARVVPLADYSQLAHEAYAIADAMLQARGH